MEINDSIRIRKAFQSPFPSCELCYGRLNLPCRLSFGDHLGDVKHYIVCAGCYKTAMCLQRFFDVGYLVDSRKYDKKEKDDILSATST